MSLFALAAAIPAVVVAFFFVLLIRGVDVWFSSRVETMVNTYGDISKYVYDSERERLNEPINATANDLSRYADVLVRRRKPMKTTSSNLSWG